MKFQIEVLNPNVYFMNDTSDGSVPSKYVDGRGGYITGKHPDIKVVWDQFVNESGTITLELDTDQQQIRVVSLKESA